MTRKGKCDSHNKDYSLDSWHATIVCIFHWVRTSWGRGIWETLETWNTIESRAELSKIQSIPEPSKYIQETLTYHQLPKMGSWWLWKRSEKLWIALDSSGCLESTWYTQVSLKPKVIFLMIQLWNLHLCFHVRQNWWVCEWWCRFSPMPRHICGLLHCWSADVALGGS